MPATVLGRNRHAEQAEVGHLRQDSRVELMCAIELTDSGRHFASRPFADGLLEQALLVGQIETEHQADGATDAAGFSGGFRKRTSRRFVLRRNCSTIRAARTTAGCHGSAAVAALARGAHGRCCSLALSTTTWRVLRPTSGCGCAVPENARSTPSGRSIRMSCSASGFADFLSR